ncbi:DUF1307 domain-containing protein [Oceanobacillus jeddahense]|uniref:DUF1307 domain-containing protein n=1 Tax=Oceanobacillus jeddahense TaxID=1462527 RepID=A0ABY5JTX9_9BACI|nr:DUF1307 domain-containing protein [Oceanobacillus jeddahense]UUI03793.1 DUF1307 domain-containing protein [Oceanobacillus jeddahense]
MAQYKNLKMAGFILMLMSFTALAACGSNQETVTYKLEEDNNSIETSFVADDGEIIEQSSQSITSYESIKGIETKEDAEALLIPSAEPLQGIEGLEYNLDFEEDHFIETITIDFSIVELSELPGLNEILTNEEENLNLEDAIESLEEQGFKKVD